MLYRRVPRCFADGSLALKARSKETRELLGAPTVSDAAQALLSGRIPGRAETLNKQGETSTAAMKAEEKLARLKHAQIDGEPVILAFQAENKTFVSSQNLVLPCSCLLRRNAV
jgi:hypothetical protein